MRLIIATRCSTTIPFTGLETFFHGTPGLKPPYYYEGTLRHPEFYRTTYCNDFQTNV